MEKQDARILLAEDEPNLRFLFSRQLKHLGYTVLDFAENGLQAVEKARAEQFHLIFMDINMPELDGLAATESIRLFEKEAQRRSHIIGLTAFDYQEQCLKSGMDAFLRKPVLLKQLEETLQQWC